MRYFHSILGLTLAFSAFSFADLVKFEPMIFMGSEVSKPIITANNHDIIIKLKPVSYNIEKNINYNVKQKNIKQAIASSKKEELYYQNEVTIKDPFLVKNINYLYKMGYLPFKVISYKDNKAVLQWYAKEVPPKLVALSITSPYGILYKSAVLRFSKEHNINTPVLNTLLAYDILKRAYEHGIMAKKPFLWVYVDQHIPQKVYVWKKGKYVFVSPANTGVMGTTTIGTYMVYIRYKKATMKGYFPGTNTYYEDPDVPWINYFYRGEAIHGFPRRHYGYPQSAGCVELPIYKAKELYPMLYKYVVVTLSNYDKGYLATHPYKPAPPPKLKVLNPLKLTLGGW